MCTRSMEYLAIQSQYLTIDGTLPSLPVSHRGRRRSCYEHVPCLLRVLGYATGCSCTHVDQLVESTRVVGPLIFRRGQTVFDHRQHDP